MPLAVLFALSGFSGPAQAANITWGGQTSGGNGTSFNSGLNWFGGSAPGASDTAIFNTIGSDWGPITGSPPNLRGLHVNDTAVVLKNSGFNIHDGTIIVGDAGTADLYLDGASLNYFNSSTAVIGSQSGSQGTLTFDRFPSSWFSEDTFYVGQSGIGRLNVQNGAVFDHRGEMRLGVNVGSQGFITVDNTRSFGFGNTALIGDRGTGDVLITNRALVNSGLLTWLGNSVGSRGTVRLDGPGLASWGNLAWYSRSLRIGNGGDGEVFVEDGARFRSFGTTTLGHGGTGHGTVTVRGTDSTGATNKGSHWDHIGAIQLGEFGTGTILIEGGGIVGSSFTSGDLRRGNVTVDGAASRFILRKRQLSVGSSSSTGNLSIQNGAFTISKFAAVEQGTVTVEGAGSGWNANDEIFMYSTASQPTELIIQDGGAVETDLLWLTSLSSRPGPAVTTVTGSGSLLEVYDDLNVGTFGIGELVVANDGAVIANRTQLGEYFGIGEGTLTIDGGTFSTGTLSFRGSSTIEFNTGEFRITNGGLTVGTIDPALSLDATRTLTVSGTTTIAAAEALSLDGGVMSTGKLVQSPGSTFTFNSGTLSITNDDLTVSEIQPTLSLDSTKTLNVSSATIVESGETLTVDGGTLSTGALELMGGGAFSLNRGTLEFTGTGTNLTGGLTVGGGSPATDATLRMSSGSEATIDLLTLDSPGGGMHMNGGTLHVGQLVKAAGGTVALDAGVLDIIGSGTDLSSIGLTTISSAETATLQMSSGGVATFDTLALSAGGEVNVSGGTLDGGGANGSNNGLGAADDGDDGGALSLSGGQATITAGTLDLTGGKGGNGRGGGDGGLGGTLTVSGGQLTLAGGLTDLSGGNGGTGLDGIFGNSGSNAGHGGESGLLDLTSGAGGVGVLSGATLSLAGGDGGNGGDADGSSGNGGRGGDGTNGGVINLAAGAGVMNVHNGATVRLSGGDGGNGGDRGSSFGNAGSGGHGGNGGDVYVLGGELILAGTLDLSGGTGGVKGIGSGGSNGVAGVVGTLSLDGGKLSVDALGAGSLENLLVGNFVYDSGTLRLTDAGGFVVGSPGIVGDVLGGTAANVPVGKALEVDETLFFGAGTTLTLAGGTISAGQLDSSLGGSFSFGSGALNITGGDFQVGTISPSLSLDATRSLSVSATTIVGSAETLALEGGVLSTGVLDVDAAGELDFNTGTVSILGTGTNLATLLTVGDGIGSAATLAVVSDADAQFADLALASNGVINVDGGTLSAGVLDNTGGGTLNLNSGALNITSDNPTVQKFGSTILTLAMDQTLNVTSTMTIAAGETLTLSGGTLGAGVLVKDGTGALNWGTGTLNITGGTFAIGTLGPSLSLLDEMTLEVAGTTLVGAGETLSLDGGTLNTIDLDVDASGTFAHNSGTLNLDGTITSMTSSAFSGASFGPGGTITVGDGSGQTATFNVGGSTSISFSEITLASNGTLSIGGGALTADTILGTEEGAAVNINSGSLSLTGTGSDLTGASVTLGDGSGQSATLDVPGGASATLAELALESNAQLNISGGDVTAFSLLNTAGGAVNFGSGTLTLAYVDSDLTGGSFTVGDGGPQAATLLIDEGAAVEFGDLTLAANAVLTVEEGLLAAATIDNTAGGAFSVNNGILSFGSFTGDLVQAGGMLSPGDPFGESSVTGNLTLGSDATLQIDIGGPTPIIEHDQVNATGAVNLAGTLDVHSAAIVVTTGAQLYSILRADSDAAGGESLSGFFDTVNLPEEDGLQRRFSLLYENSATNGAGVVDTVKVGLARPGDGDFNSAVDAIDLLAASPKFGTTTPANWRQGNWNNTGGSQDLVDAIDLLDASPFFGQTYAGADLSLRGDNHGLPNDGKPSICYDYTTGEILIDTDGNTIDSYVLTSTSQIFTGATPNLIDAGNLFVQDEDFRISENFFSPQLSGVHSLGLVAQAGLSQAFLISDLELRGGLTGNANFQFDLIVKNTPEPSTLVLLALGLVGLVGVVRRRR